MRNSPSSSQIPGIGTARPLPAVQVTRGIAASMVVADHALERLISRGYVPEDVLPLAYVLGWAGVGTFFVTSGMIMVHTTRTGFGSVSGAASFFSRRVVRVVPMYWIATIVALAVAGFSSSAAEVVKSLLFVPYSTANASVMRPVLGVGWTLNYEMAFYFLFAVCMAFRVRVAALLLSTALVGATVIGFVARESFLYSDPVTVFDFYTDPIVLFFLAGAVLGWIEKSERFRSGARFSVALQILLLLGSSVVFWILGGSFPMHLGWQAVFLLVAVSTVYVAMLAEAVRFSSRSLLREYLLKIGDASYSTYLFHIFWVGACTLILPAALPMENLSAVVAVAFVVLCIGGANVVGVLIHRLIERPLTSRLRSYLN